MIFFLLAIFAVSFAGAKYSGYNKFNTGYLSKDSTNAINGIFVLLVFLKHACDQAKLSPGVFDKPYLTFGENMGQLVVTAFLFYSGFGIMRSIMSKGMPYVKVIPKNRLLKVLLHFDMAVLVFIAVNILLKNDMKPLDILLSFVGWSSVGNSNWYIFAIMALYIIVYISFTIFKGKIYPSLVLSLALIFGFIALMFAVRQPAYFYNTLACYGLGMVFGVFKEKIEKVVMKDSLIYISIFAAVFVSFSFLSLSRHVKTLPHSLWAILFTLLIVLLSMKIKIGNDLLSYFGKRVFSIYILQRIPMMIFKKIPLIFSNAYIYILVCFVCTLLAAELFERLTNAVDKRLFV